MKTKLIIASITMGVLLGGHLEANMPASTTAQGASNKNAGLQNIGDGAKQIATSVNDDAKNTFKSPAAIGGTVAAGVGVAALLAGGAAIGMHQLHKSMQKNAKLKNGEASKTSEGVTVTHEIPESATESKPTGGRLHRDANAIKTLVDADNKLNKKQPASQEETHAKTEQVAVEHKSLNLKSHEHTKNHDGTVKAPEGLTPPPSLKLHHHGVSSHNLSNHSKSSHEARKVAE